MPWPPNVSAAGVTDLAIWQSSVEETVKVIALTAEQNNERAVADRLLSARQIAAELFGGTVSEQWVKRTVAPNRRLRLGHSTLRWWRSDIQAWLAGHRDVSAAKPNYGHNE